jgi:hypothetical protein
VSKEHWNIQINIQRVTEPEKLLDTGGYPVKVASREVLTERTVTKVLDLAITAETETEAYVKAHRMLVANAGWDVDVPGPPAAASNLSGKR